MTDLKKEFQRVFEFIVKHGPKINWPNRNIKKFLLWAWEQKHLHVLYDGIGSQRRIAAISIVWQTDHPENLYENFENYDEKEGEYLSVYGVIVHPEYRNKGCMLMLLMMAMKEYPQVTKVFWNKHGRNQTGLKITNIPTLGRELLKERTMASFGGSKQVEVPKVKSLGDLTGEATQANIAQLPLIIEAMQKYGPEFASSLLETNYASNPTLKPLGDLLTQRLTDAQGGGIPEYLRSSATQALRGAQGIRGFADSPISAAQEAFGLADIADRSTNNTINSALDFSRLDGTTVSLADLGLDLPGIGDQTGRAQEQNISMIQAALDENARKKSNKSGAGAIIGAGAGGLIGLAGGPIGAIQGAQIGGQIGTFF